MRKILDYLFKLDYRRSSLGAIGLYLAHCLLLFSIIVVALNIAGLILGTDSLLQEDLKVVFVTISLIISLSYVFYVIYPVSKPFPKTARYFAIGFSLLSTFFTGFYMGLLLPVMMTTMLPEQDQDEQQ